MTCRDIRQCLSEGRPLSAEAQAHIAGCPICQALASTDFDTAERLEPQALSRFKAAATNGLVAVRPLPSDRQLTFLLIALFFCFIIGAALPSGTAGLHALRPGQLILYYGALTLSVLFTASAIVQEITPGSRRYLNTGRVLLVEGAGIVLLTALLFHSVSTHRFVEFGHGCFELGASCSLASAVLFSYALRGGYPVAPVRTGIVTGFFAGLSGVAVLAVHCPLLTFAHIATWHLCMLPLGMGVGALAGLLIQKRASLRNLRARSGEAR